MKQREKRRKCLVRKKMNEKVYVTLQIDIRLVTGAAYVRNVNETGD